MTTMPNVVEQPHTAGCCGDALEVPAAADVQQASDDLQILGHPIRLQILMMLARGGGDVCVCDLEAALPVKQPTVSHHLRLLREAGLIDAERRGQWAYYFIRHDALYALRDRVARHLAVLG
jgi:ArsR family transcriptional regulator